MDRWPTGEVLALLMIGASILGWIVRHKSKGRNDNGD